MIVFNQINVYIIVREIVFIEFLRNIITVWCNIIENVR